MYISRTYSTISNIAFSRIVPVFLIVFTAGLGCGPSASESSLQFARSSDDPVVTVASTTQMEVLNEKLPDGLAITRAYAVRATNETFGHYVAAKLRRPVDSLWDGRTMAIWYMPDGMDVPGPPFAVDSTARSFGSTPGYTGVTSAEAAAQEEIAALVALTRARP